MDTLKGKMVMDHTPTPWSNPGFSVTVRGSDNGKIADMSSASYDVDVQEANAAFIVLACNNFGPLLKVSKSILMHWHQGDLHSIDFARLETILNNIEGGRQ